MKNLVILSICALALVGCSGSSDTGADAAQEKAFKNPDKANLPKPPAGAPMSTPAVSSLDKGNAPAGVSSATPKGN